MGFFFSSCESKVKAALNFVRNISSQGNRTLVNAAKASRVYLEAVLLAESSLRMSPNHQLHLHEQVL